MMLPILMYSEKFCSLDAYPIRHIKKGWGGTSYTTTWPASLKDEKLIVPNVTCFADIPWTSLSVHIKKYGKFGLSFPRDFPIKYGARPVIYIPLRSDDWGAPNGATMLREIEAAYSGYHQFLHSLEYSNGETLGRALGQVPRSVSESVAVLRKVFEKDFLAFIKPFDSQLEGLHDDNYYMEREWRRFGNLPFEPDNVERIIVAQGYSSSLKKEFPQYENKVHEI